MLRKIIAAVTAGAVIAAAPVVHASEPVECSTLFSAGYRGVSHGLPNPGSILNYNADQTRIAAETVKQVDAYAKVCDEIKIVGYSYGAAVVHTALETIDTRPYAGKVHVTLYGNPRHPGGIEDFNLTDIPGVGFRGAGIVPQNLGFFADHCNPRDAICDFPYRNPIKSIDHIIGYFTGAHKYPDLIKEIA